MTSSMKHSCEYWQGRSFKCASSNNRHMKLETACSARNQFHHIEFSRILLSSTRSRLKRAALPDVHIYGKMIFFRLCPGRLTFLRVLPIFCFYSFPSHSIASPTNSDISKYIICCFAKITRSLWAWDSRVIKSVLSRMASISRLAKGLWRSALKRRARGPFCGASSTRPQSSWRWGPPGAGCGTRQGSAR